MYGCKIFSGGKLPCLCRVLLIKVKSLLLENALVRGKIFACGKLTWSWKNLYFWKSIFLCKTSLKKKKFFLWEASFIMEKYLLVKILWSRKNLCLWKVFLINEKLCISKIFTCGKRPWSKKNLGFCKVLSLWRTSFMKEKYWLVEKFFDWEKIIGLKSCRKEGI